MRNNEIVALETLSKQLEKDMALIQSNLATSDNSDFWKRMCIQTLYIHLETIVKMMKLHSKEYTEFYTPSEIELFIINGNSYELKENGEVKTKPAKTVLYNEFKFALKMFAKTCDAIDMPDRYANRLTAIKEIIALRNRVIHPKTNKDLIISDDELGEFYKFWTWFLILYNRLLEAYGNKLKIKLENLQKASENNDFDLK